MDKNTHVYCYNCKNGEGLFKNIEDSEANKLPKDCEACFPYNPEDSYRLECRKNYVEKSNEEITTSGVIEYLSSFVEDMQDKIAKGDKNNLLYEERILFINKAIEICRKSQEEFLWK